MTKPNTPQPPTGQTTYSPEYIKDRERIDTLAKNIQNQILQLNKQLQIIQITDFKFALAEYNKHLHVVKLPFKRRAWLKFIKLASIPVLFLQSVKALFKRK